MKTLVAVDGNSLMHRAYYAIQTAMTNRDGVPTNALHGFVAMLVKLIERNPDYMLVAFDMHGGTFRHDAYPEYKAGRKETPEDLRPQFPALKEILTSMGIAVCECFRYEADDILGTISQVAGEAGVDTLIVTGDHDALQLISDKTHVLLTKKGISETVEYDESLLFETYGLTPKRMVDLKALMGDSSDNIPGIKGVGEKTALTLLSKYGDVESVLENALNEKGALQKKLLEGGGSARLSYELGTICRTAPIDMGLEDCRFDMKGISNGIPTLGKYGLRANIARIKALSDGGAGNGAAMAEGKKPDAAGMADTEAVADTKAAPTFEKTVEVRTSEQLCKMVSHIMSARLIALNVANTLTIVTERGAGFEVFTGGNLLELGLAPDEIYSALAPVLQSDTIKKVVFDAKKLMTQLSRFGVELNGVAFDLTVADYLLNALNPAKTLELLIESTGVSVQNAEAVMTLFGMLDAELSKKGMSDLYYGVELPLVSVLYSMERAGFAVDSDVLRTLGDDMRTRMEHLELDAYVQAGHQFNILSPKQLSVVLFDEKKLPPQKKTKTGYSTDSDVLEALSGLDPIIEIVTEYRFLSKLKSTFIDAMLDKIGADGRIHTTLNQNVTATGRISSAEPNLQNIPVRTELGREIRRAFVASAGNILVGADYSQIELRVLAHLSGDTAFTQAFTTGEDIHTRTASEVFGVPVSEVTRDMRSAAKAVNFGIVYGISEFGLAAQLGIPRYKAKEYISKYLDRCTGVRDYMKASVESGKRLGYAATITGRRRDLPELKSGNYNTRSFGERVAMNMPVQGSAADIIKLAMVRVYRRLKQGGFAAKLVLQIHDELIIDCPTDEAEAVSVLLHDCMTGNAPVDESSATAAVAKRVKLNVPLIADVASGHSWFDTK